MIKEIGSIFPLEDTYCPHSEPVVDGGVSDFVLYSLCREALYDIAVSLNGYDKKVLIPAYTCETVITPFEEAGWTCCYYNINKDLRIDTEYLEDLSNRIEPALVVVHPYYGMSLNDQESDTLRKIHEKGALIVLDLTHCIFAEPKDDFVDYYVGSYRKWFPIPDGAFLKAKDARFHIPQDENVDFVTKQADAMYLRNQYFQSEVMPLKAISIRLNKLAEGLADHHIKPHRMSSFSQELKQRENVRVIEERRRENFAFLFNHLNQGPDCRFICSDLSDLSASPLYFAIYVENRESLQRVLAENRIYAPVLWPNAHAELLISEDVTYIYQHILAIPCDQRYGKEDMERIVCVINGFTGK